MRKSDKGTEKLLIRTVRVSLSQFGAKMDKNYSKDIPNPVERLALKNQIAIRMNVFLLIKIAQNNIKRYGLYIYDKGGFRTVVQVFLLNVPRNLDPINYKLVIRVSIRLPPYIFVWGFNSKPKFRVFVRLIVYETVTKIFVSYTQL